VGAGPEALVEGGLFDRLSSDGLDARLRVVELGGGSRHEVGSAFELAGLISKGVRSSLNAGAFPLVLSGNCNGCVGTLGGLGGKDPGILWLDGHADFHTPETTTSGFTDCMGLSIAVGHCWRGMAARVPGFEPVPEANAVLVGAREIEPGERERLLASRVGVVAPKTGLLEELDAALVGLSERVRGIVPPYRSRRAGSCHGRQGQRVRASGRANGRGGRVSYPAGAGAR
jgi:arginase